MVQECISTIQRKTVLITGNDPELSSEHVNTSKLIKILNKCGYQIYAISHCEMEGDLGIVDGVFINNKVKGIFGYVMDQLLIIKAIYKFKKAGVRVSLFAFGQDLKPLPIIVAKIFGMLTILRTDGRYSGQYMSMLGKRDLKYYYFKAIESLNYRIVDTLVLENKSLFTPKEALSYSAKIGHMFVDVSIFTNRLSWMDRGIDIAYVGRFEEEKGVDDAIDVIRMIGPGRKSLLVGTGSQIDRVLKRINDLKTDGYDVEVRGWVTPNELNRVLNNVKVVILTSKREGLPNIILESIACGAIVASYDVGAVHDIIVDGQTGILTGIGEKENLARKIVAFFKSGDPDVLRTNAANIINNEYTLEAVCRSYLSFLPK